MWLQMCRETLPPSSQTQAEAGDFSCHSLLRVGFSRTSASYQISYLVQYWTPSLGPQSLLLFRMRTLSHSPYPTLPSSPGEFSPLCIFLTVLLVRQYILKGVVKKLFCQEFLKRCSVAKGSFRIFSSPNIKFSFWLYLIYILKY